MGALFAFVLLILIATHATAHVNISSRPQHLQRLLSAQTVRSSSLYPHSTDILVLPL